MTIFFVMAFALNVSLSIAMAADHDRRISSPLIDKNQSSYKSPGNVQQVKALLEVAHSTNTHDRESALQQLSNPDIKSKGGLREIYMSLLDGSDPAVRDAAIQACAKLEYKETVPKIRALLMALPKHPFDPKKGMDQETHEEFRHGMTAACALSKMKDWDSVKDILDREALSMGWATFLPNFGASVLPLVLEKARSDREAVRSGALKTISAIRDEDALPQLRALLSDDDHQIRAGAVVALAKLKSPQALAALENSHERLDKTSESIFVEAYVARGDPSKAMQYAEAFLNSGSPSDIKTNVIRSIGAAMKPEFVPHLKKILKDKDEIVRSEAACQLARLTGKRYSYSETDVTRLREAGCAFIQKLNGRKGLKP